MERREAAPVNSSGTAQGRSPIACCIFLDTSLAAALIHINNTAKIRENNTMALTENQQTSSSNSIKRCLMATPGAESWERWVHK